MSRRRGTHREGRVTVNGYSERWLRRGFPWVYPKELTGGAPRAGARVELQGPSGQALGRGIADQGWIAVRVFRHDGGPLDQAWLDETLDRAAALRERVVDEETTGFRLVHGENDGLPGVRIDWWDHFAVIALDSPSLRSLVPGLVDWLERRRSPRGVYLCYRPDPRDDLDLSNVSPAAGWVHGRGPTTDITVRELGLRYRVRPGEGPDVGLYADMRGVRSWLAPHWGGRTVLNTFSFTGAFSVSAAYHGAMEVVSVDLSPRVLERAEENFRANELDPAQHDFIASDTFKALDRFRRTGRSFDLVLLDPPSFSRAKEGVWSAKRDYPRLVTSAARVLEPDGWLVAASNQGELSPRDFRGLVADGLRKARRSAQEIWWGGAGPDFPAAVSFPEGRYLKVGVWRLT